MLFRFTCFFIFLTNFCFSFISFVLLFSFHKCILMLYHNDFCFAISFYCALLYFYYCFFFYLFYSKAHKNHAFYIRLKSIVLPLCSHNFTLLNSTIYIYIYTAARVSAFFISYSPYSFLRKFYTYSSFMSSGLYNSYLIFEKTKYT